MTFGRGKPSEARRGWAARYAGKRWKEAYDAYKAAYALEQTYKIAGNLGDVAVTLGKHREGAEYLSHALRTMPDDKAALKKQVQARLEQAKKEIGTLSITVNVEGAQVACDGRDVGKAPIEGEVFVEAGATSVVVKAEGHKDARRTVALAKGETKALEITLETDPNAGAVVPVGPSGGTGGTGGTSGTEPGNGAGGAAGDGASADANGGVDTGGMSTKTVVVIAGSALTALSAGLSVYFLISAGSANDEASDLAAQVERDIGDNQCRPGLARVCDDLVDALERRGDNRRNATIGLAATGVFGLGTVAAWLLWPDAKEDARATKINVAAQPSMGGGYINVHGRF